jgi:uncharacterized spore protein YtfJ
MTTMTTSEETAMAPATGNGEAASPPKLDAVLARLDGIRDALTVQRVFGTPYEQNGVTIVPVAALWGGGGGGGGQGTGPDPATGGSGAGLGFGVSARPLGVYEIRDGTATWKPAVDRMRVILGAQVLVGLMTLVVARALARRHT